MKKGIKLSVVGLTAVAGLLISTNVLASEVAKDGNQIQVTEPEITYSSEAAETYVNKDLTYHTEIPDEVEINEGDTLTYTLPEQLQWTTKQEFDVTSPEGGVVGHAVASNGTQSVTTTFNSYFAEHPLNKSFDMTLKTMWKKEVVTDTWDDNNEYVEGSMRIFELSSAEPWVGIREIPLTEANVQFYKNGFKFSLPDVQNIISVEYKTRLKNKLQNPVNVLSFTAMGQEYSFEREITVANATGSAKGKVRPFTYDVPPAPVYDIPEFEGGVVPNDPPVLDKPELNIDDIEQTPPAPIFELPEWQGGTTPLDPPTFDKPEWNGGVVPNDPPALDLPELVIPEEPKSLEKEPPAPSTKEEPKNAAESKLEASVNELPKTGEVSNVFLSIFGISLLISGAMIWQDNKKK